MVAPFDGVITERNVDVGTLVQGNATSGTFMFEIMQEDVIRVRVYVPQNAAFGVAPGVEAIVRVPELPDREFRGKVTRIADALQPSTRTLLTEVDIPNPDGALAPGIYCTVELRIPRKTPSVSVPAGAIIFNSDGTQVAVVSDGKAEIRKVKVERDLGTRVEVDAGIKAGDQVILNPPVNLVDGSKVQARTDTAAVRPSPVHRYFRPRSWRRLRLFPYNHRPGSHVPYKSPVEIRAVYMPDAARAVSGHPPS